MIDRVTIINGYVRLSFGHSPNGGAGLRHSIERLSELARGENRQSLIAALDVLIQAIEQECAPRSLAAHA